MAELRSANRGVTPVVDKTLAIGLTVLYVAGMTTVLLGGVVPAYETRAGGELGERVLANVAGEVERSPPSVDGHAETRTTVTVPPTIANSGYTLSLRSDPDRLVLEHPDSTIETETRLSLPENVTLENETVDGGSKVVITVAGPPANRTLTIEEGGS